MATKKQQKRRRKMRVHGTYVRDAPQQPSRPQRESRAERRPRRAESRGSGSRWVRVPPEPTLQRSLKRSATLVFPFLLLIWFFVGKSQDHDVTTFVTTVIAPTLLFIPFDYYATGFMNRMLKRRMARR